MVIKVEFEISLDCNNINFKKRGGGRKGGGKEVVTYLCVCDDVKIIWKYVYLLDIYIWRGRGGNFINI